jgi:hypothetical protein
MAPKPRIVHQVGSSCHHFSPWRAEYSKAWWLLCHPSPYATIATHLKIRVPHMDEIKHQLVEDQSQLHAIKSSSHQVDRSLQVTAHLVGLNITEGKLYFISINCRKAKRGTIFHPHQLFLDKSPVFHGCVPHTWDAEFTNQVTWYTHTNRTACIPKWASQPINWLLK